MFHVYENWTNDRCRIHKSHCTFAKSGEGLRGAPSGRNGKWHGPFDSREAAFRAAATLGHSNTSACGFCSP